MRGRHADIDVAGGGASTAALADDDPARSDAIGAGDVLGEGEAVPASPVAERCHAP